MFLYEVSSCRIVFYSKSSLKIYDFKNVSISTESLETYSSWASIIEILLTSGSIKNEFVEPITTFEVESILYRAVICEGI